MQKLALTNVEEGSFKLRPLSQVETFRHGWNEMPSLMIWKQKREKYIILLILQTEGLTRGSLYFATHKETWKYQLPVWYKIKKLKKKKTNKQAIENTNKKNWLKRRLSI